VTEIKLPNFIILGRALAIAAIRGIWSSPLYNPTMALRKLDEIKRAVESLSSAEKVELAEFLMARAHEKYPGRIVDPSPYHGTAHFGEDAMEMQRRWRAEWD
jgi:hypothetical protein